MGGCILAYATLDMVKERLSITHPDVDTQLDNKLTQANGMVDLELEPYVTVPLPAPDQKVKDAEADIAAGLFREETSGRFAGERPLPHVLRQRGMEALKAYIRAKYLGPVSRAGYLRHSNSHHPWDRNHESKCDTR